MPLPHSPAGHQHTLCQTVRRGRSDEGRLRSARKIINLPGKTPSDSSSLLLDDAPSSLCALICSSKENVVVGPAGSHWSVKVDKQQQQQQLEQQRRWDTFFAVQRDRCKKMEGYKQQDCFASPRDVHHHHRGPSVIIVVVFRHLTQCTVSLKIRGGRFV